MPNRGELPIPAARAKRTAGKGKSGAEDEAWTVIAFCAIGGLMTFYFALATVGANSFPSLIAQMPWG